jgi:hypothetical protein
MFVPSESTIILAVLGSVGLIATGIILTYAFRHPYTR